MAFTAEQIEHAAREAYLNAWARGGQLRSVGEERWLDAAISYAPWRRWWIEDVTAALSTIEDAA